MRYWLYLLLSLLLVAPLGASRAEQTTLPITPEAWAPKVFTDRGVPEQEGAAFRIVTDPTQGPVLSIGRWTNGRWSARYESTKPLSCLKGVIRGIYRTQGVEGSIAEVSVRYYREDRQVHSERTILPPAADWTPFEFSFRRPPPGTDKAFLAVGLRRHTDGTVFFGKLSVDEAVQALEFPATPPPITRPAPPTDFSPGRYFRVQQREGVWWLVSPSGKAFYSVGTDGPWKRPDDARTQAEADAQDVDWLHVLRANSLAGWTDIDRWAPIDDRLAAAGEAPFAIFLAMETGTWWGDFDHVLDSNGDPQSRNHAFPDPFDPNFEKAYRREVRRIVGLVGGKPWHAGWFADNEIAHRDLYRYPYSEHCAAAFRHFLQLRYGDIRNLNDAWRTSFSSFQQIADDKPAPPSADCAMTKDFYLFSREIVKKYVDVTLKVFHEEDPGRLVFSPRLMFGDTEYADLYARYDGIAVNCYPDNDQPGLGQPTIDRLRALYETCKRPLLIGEWSIPSVDSGLYDDPENLDWSWPQVVPTQTDRARQAACVTIDFYNLPFLVGAHWFIWRDFDSEERRANRGLFTADGRPYLKLIGALAGAHEKIGAPVLNDPYTRSESR